MDLPFGVKSSLSIDQRDACDRIIKRLRAFHSKKCVPRRGRTAQRVASREQLIEEHNSLAANAPFPHAQEGVHVILVEFMCPPCLTPLQKLAPIFLADLRSGEPHRGRVLIVRTLVKPKRFSATFFVIEDTSGTIDRMLVFEHATKTTALEILAPGSVLAVKEPRLQLTPEGPLVRVDHTTDLDILPRDHNMLPACFKTDIVQDELTGEACKIKGNACFQSGLYREASAAYSLGISLCTTSETLLKADLHRNRAATNNQLQQYGDAIEDAKAAFLPCGAALDAGKMNALNAKALRRAATAHYACRDFKAAKNQLTAALALVPDDEIILREHARALERWQERSTGIYDFEKLAATVTVKKTRLDIADYKANIQIRGTSKDHYGIFATVLIKQGEIVLVEKALASCYTADNRHHRAVEPVKGDTPLFGVHTLLADQIYEKLRHQPNLAARLAELYDGEDCGPIKLHTVQDVKVVDFAVLDKFVHKWMRNLPTLCTMSSREQNINDPNRQFLVAESNDTPKGVWLTGNHLKHACNGKCHSSVIGDVAIFSALRDISAGERLTQVEVQRNPNHTRTLEMYQLIGEDCTCSIRTTENKVAGAVHSERARLFDCVDNRPPFRDLATLLTSQLDLTKQMEKTFDPTLYRGKPRYALFVFYNPLAWMSEGKASKATTIKYYCNALAACGVVVTIADDNVRIDCRNIVWMTGLIDCALSFSRFLVGIKKPQMARALRQLATNLYRAQSGQRTRGLDQFRWMLPETKPAFAIRVWSDVR